MKAWKVLYIVTRQLIERHLIETAFDRIMKEKIYNVGSIPVLPICCPKHIVISKKGLHFESVPVLSSFRLKT